MSNFRTEWNALGKLIGLALQVATLISFIYAVIIVLYIAVGI